MGLWRVDDPLIAPLLPAGARDDVMLLWQLDARLAQIATIGNEPALRQIRMRWWADQLHGLGEGAPITGEPLLATVAVRLRHHAGQLAALGEAWMAVVSDDDAPAAAMARGSALMVQTLILLGAEPRASVQLGAGWGVADAILAGRVDGANWFLARDRLSAARLRTLPRALAALGAVSRAVARRSGTPAPRRDQLTILRAGLLGG